MAKKFIKNICKIVGHDNQRTWNCTRCGKEKDIHELQKQLAAALQAPLRVPLDYIGISKKLKVDILEQGDLPVYDKDLPRKPKVKKRAKRSS